MDEEQVKRELMIKVLQFIVDNGGSCTEEEWKEFEERDKGKTLGPTMEIDLIGDGYVENEERVYRVTERGTNKLSELKSQV